LRRAGAETRLLARWNALSPTRWLRHAALPPNICAFRRVDGHRLQEKPIHLGTCEGGTRCPQRVGYDTRLCRRISAPSANRLPSSSEKPIHLRKQSVTFLAVASRPLQRRPRRNNLSFLTIEDMQGQRRNVHRFETRSLSSPLGASSRGLPFISLISQLGSQIPADFGRDLLNV
jgi:hypothetical protein